LLTGQSETSIALVKIILEKFYSIKPRYCIGDVSDPKNFTEKISAVLAIGDDALRLKEEPHYPIQLDLADVWNIHTGLAFVFAVFAVREEFAASQPLVLNKIWQTLIDCRNMGKTNLETISQLVAPRIPMEVEYCHRYLKNIEHNLDSNHQMALKTFFQYLIERNDGSTEALPLKFFPSELGD
jgi:chorismate dehydratase